MIKIERIEENIFFKCGAACNCCSKDAVYVLTIGKEDLLHKGTFGVCPISFPLCKECLKELKNKIDEIN